MSERPAWRWDGETKAFDHSLAAALLGKVVLVGITYLNEAGEPDEQRQFQGRVVRVNEAEGVVLVQSSGDETTLPPALEAFEPATPGEYRLRSTGEVIIDPDYTSTWTLQRPVRH